MANKLKLQAREVLRKTIKELGLAEGDSFYAREVEKVVETLLESNNLSSDDYYELVKLVHAITLRCLGIAADIPHFRQVQQVQSKLNAT